jgi:hypothetical protein
MGTGLRQESALQESGKFFHPGAELLSAGRITAFFAGYWGKKRVEGLAWARGE